jgi:ABC-type lipoprotein release transport system permease subunit
MKEAKRIQGLVIPIICFLLLFPLFNYDVHAVNSTFIEGLVIDGLTDQPIGNATIQVWDTTPGSSSVWILVEEVRTNGNGYYSINIEREFQCRVYAYYNDSSSPGFDYVPSFQDFYFSGEKQLLHELKPGGSIIFEGVLRIVESIRPSDVFGFTVLDPDTGSRLEGEGDVYDYGTEPPYHNFLEVDPKHIIVPAYIPVEIMINTTISVDNLRVERTFLVSQVEPFILEKGEKKQVGIDESLLRFNVDLIEKEIVLIDEALVDVEEKGFYTTLERQDSAQVKDLVDRARRKLTEGAFDESYADLREAYINTVQINQRINAIFSDASSSVSILTLFLTLTAMVLSSFLFERWPLKIIGTCVISSVLLILFFYTYPGLRIIQTSSFFINIGLALMVAFSASFIFSRFMDRKITSIISIAKQNLRRRKLRFILTVLSVTVLTMSFVTLTSFSTGYGLTSTSMSNLSLESKGLLVKNPLSQDLPSTITFIPLDFSTINWLQDKSEILGAAPKMENVPNLGGIGSLSSLSDPSKKVLMTGILGIELDLEAEATHIDDVIVEGRYIDGLKEKEVLISSTTAELLNAKIGDDLLLVSRATTINVTLVGLLDNNKFNQIKDIDTEPLIPNKLVIQNGERPTIVIEPCDASEVIVMNWKTANLFGGIFLSRIDVQLVDPNLALSIARQIALERDLLVWSAYDGQIYKTGLGEYLETSGISILIPWVIVILNVVITMMNAIFERRREIAILSSVGLNPSHIGSLFMAEAAIIGIVGGGVGYMLGLGGYQVMSALSITVGVRQKISAAWSLASLGIAVVAVLVGAGIAIKNSVSITPSTLRRWTMEQKVEDKGEVLEFQIPIRLRTDEVDPLLNFVKREVQASVRKLYPRFADWIEKRTTISEEKTLETHVKIVDFKYAFGQRDAALGRYPFRLIAEKKREEKNYSLRIMPTSRFGADSESVTSIVSFIRMLIVDWSARAK